MPLHGAPPAFFGSVGLSLGTESTGNWQISCSKARDYLERIAQFLKSSSTTSQSALSNPTGVCIFGAEPFLQPDDLESLLDCAAAGNLTCEVVTGTSWVTSKGTADQVIDRLRGRLHLLTICTGRADIDRFGISALEDLLLAARSSNLSLQIYVRVGPGQPFPREILNLEAVNCDMSIIRIDPLRSIHLTDDVQWPRGYLLQAPPRFARCAELMAAIIAPNGDVYPCAGGVGFSELCLGNLELQSIQDILLAATAKKNLIQLREQGPFFLYKEWQQFPATEMPSEGYLSACDFHRQFLTRTSLA